jgi:hypothetical protein
VISGLLPFRIKENSVKLLLQVSKALKASISWYITLAQIVMRRQNRVIKSFET